MSHFKMIALHITLTRFAIYLRSIIVLIKDVATRYTRMMMVMVDDDYCYYYDDDGRG